jgi:hypothetical protein
MQLMSFDGVMMSKIMTGLYDGRHRAPHRCEDAILPTVVLMWALSHRSLRCHWLIVIFVH